MDEKAVDALLYALYTCRAELHIIGNVVDKLHNHHNPEAVDWTLVGDFQHLATMLVEARQFIRNEEAE